MQANENPPGGKRLPFCTFPTASDTALHGFQTLPAGLTVFSVETALPYHSSKCRIVSADSLNKPELLQLAKIIAASFAINDPMIRHLNIPKNCPAGLLNIRHADPFGDHEFGEWTKENIVYWYIRLFVFTDPLSPPDAIALNNRALKHSFAAIDDHGGITGGVLNIVFDLTKAGGAMRNNDAFIKAVLPFFGPVSQVSVHQLNQSINLLCKTYPDFLADLRNTKVADLNMIARSPSMPSEDVFELVATTVLHLQAAAYTYLIVSAGNQWTGAACEILGGTKVHFAPYRKNKTVDVSTAPIDHLPTSPDGYISDKDSGCMLYVIRLN